MGSYENIRSYLHTETLVLRVLEETGSTNAVLLALARSGAPEGRVILAERQTAGRGRMGRSFFSPAGTGIYMSLLLRPADFARASALVTPCAAVAAAEAIERAGGREARIKWVNDICVEGRKVCGILAEAQPETGGIVLGFGINVYPPEGGFPPELAERSGTVYPRDEGDGEARAKLAAAVLDGFMDRWPDIAEKRFLNDYRHRSLLPGLAVRVTDASGRDEAGTALYVDDDFGLVVRFASGREQALRTGEVSVAPARK